MTQPKKPTPCSAYPHVPVTSSLSYQQLPTVLLHPTQTEKAMGGNSSKGNLSLSKPKILPGESTVTLNNSKASNANAVYSDSPINICNTFH